MIAHLAKTDALFVAIGFEIHEKFFEKSILLDSGAATLLKKM